jgi:hypothetical protein
VKFFGVLPLRVRNDGKGKNKGKQQIPHSTSLRADSFGDDNKKSKCKDAMQVLRLRSG